MTNINNHIQTSEAAARLGVSIQTIRNYVRIGELDAINIGTRNQKRFRISVISIKRFEDSRRQKK